MKSIFKNLPVLFIFFFVACNHEGSKVAIGIDEDFIQAVIADVDYQSFVQSRDQVTRMSLSKSIDPILMIKYANECKTSSKNESDYVDCLNSKGSEYGKVHVLREKKRSHYELFINKFPKYASLDPSEKQRIYEMTPYFTELVSDIKNIKNNKK
jgi:hypothetical protein